MDNPILDDLMTNDKVIKEAEQLDEQQKSEIVKMHEKASLAAVEVLSTEELEKAKELSNNKPLGINLMVAMNFYEEHVKTAIESGIDIIISGAGLPIKLPKFIGNSNVKIAPIVSSAKACKLLLKMWDKKYNKTADMIVVEGPKAGGHLGFHKDDLKDIDSIDYDGEFMRILEITKEYGQKYDKEIPVIAAGGISTSSDVKKYINMGQMKMEQV